MDQDVFNIVFNSDVFYMSGYFNYMTTNNRLPKKIIDQKFPNFDERQIKIIHYTYKKPWNEPGIDRANYWYEEYRAIYKHPHPLYKYPNSVKTDNWAQNLKNSFIRNNSVLLIEAADCHGEIMPGYVRRYYFYK